ncbi:MAG: VOC family protein [Ignavibacteriaceae bacterium]|jgi:predicted 3-demethylubiquinone-9 3-methyltransferase (glyoxalase superfamily)
MQKITPFLWFDYNAEEAVNFYTSVFGNSKIGTFVRYDEAGAAAAKRPVGSVMTATFQLEGNEFIALNGGPVFKFNPSISFFVITKDEKEVDNLWTKFSDGGKVLMELNKYDWSKKYGWVEDKFGVSWQLMLTEDEIKHKIVPCFLFVDKNYGKAEAAMNYYLSVFKNSKVGGIYKYGPDSAPNIENAVMYEDFILEGNKFAAMDGAGEQNFIFNEAISFIVNRENQEEIDYYWEKLSAVPQAEMCGWLKDKFGISWQVVPSVLSKLLVDKDGKKSQRVMQAMLKMKKIIISDLEKAYNQQ